MWVGSVSPVSGRTSAARRSPKRRKLTLALWQKRDRGEAVAAMAKGAAVMLARLAAAGRIQGVISLGGGGGTAIGTAPMRALPIGFPKVMGSTLASGNTAPYVGVKDIVMFPSIVDIA